MNLRLLVFRLPLDEHRSKILLKIKMNKNEDKTKW